MALRAGGAVMKSKGSWNTDDVGRPKWGKDTKPLAEYEYKRADGSYAYTVDRGINPDGEKVFRTWRLNTKSFPDRLDPEDKVERYYNLGDEPAVLYRLPELLAARQKKPNITVLVPEGEKDVESARELGFVATCNPFGALKWKDEY
jgi:hypothetical protein